MPNIYFFQNDGECKWMENEINKLYPLLLHDPVSMNDIKSFRGMKLINKYEGKIKYFAILDWVYGKTRGANLEWLNEIGVNYVRSIYDLPDNSGIYITGYDSNIDEVKSMIKKGIPVIDHACPWVRFIKDQLMEAVENKYQVVFLIDKDHMVYNCYKSIFPEDIIIVLPENYEDEISKNYKGRPLYLITYAVFRIKESKKIAGFITSNFYHPENNVNGYLKTACCWIKQGLLEEIEEETKKQKIDTIWVICSSIGDRSTMSILNEIKETGAVPIPIRNIEDIPQNINPVSNIGILIAPIPLSNKIKNIVKIIKERYKG